MPLPALSPYKIEQLVCSKCANVMRLVTRKDGIVLVVRYYCDTCQYTFIPQLEHKNGNTNPSYQAPPPLKNVVELAIAPSSPSVQEGGQGPEGQPEASTVDLSQVSVVK